MPSVAAAMERLVLAAVAMEQLVLLAVVARWEVARWEVERWVALALPWA